MTASVQTINKFCEDTGMSRTKVKELIEDFIVPILPREETTGLVLINRLEFDRRVAANQIILPIPPRKRKELENLKVGEK